MTQKCESLQSRYDEMEASRQAEIAELRINLERLEGELHTFQQEREALSNEKGTLEERLAEIQSEKQELDLKYQECMAKMHELELKTDHYAKEEMSLQQSVNENSLKAQGKCSIHFPFVKVQRLINPDFVSSRTCGTILISLFNYLFLNHFFLF